MQIVRIGSDVGEYVFEVHRVDAEVKIVLCKILRRVAVASHFAELPACVVGVEACGGAHYWARALSNLGHEVRLISPQFVTPFFGLCATHRLGARKKKLSLTIVSGKADGRGRVYTTRN